MEILFNRNQMSRQVFGVGVRKFLGIRPMTEAEEYRRRAWRCLTLARLAVNAEARAKIVDMAEIWMRFAQRAEQQTPVVQQQQQIQPKKKAN